MQEENEQRALKDSRAEQLLTRQMQFERRPQKNLQRKETLWGKSAQEIWVRTKAQAPSDEKPILERLY